MDIVRIKWPSDHPILPNLDINLIKDDGTPFKSIVIAGDNGIGKTTILQTVYDMLCGEPTNVETFEYLIGTDKYVAKPNGPQHIQVSENGGVFHDVQLESKIHPRSPFDMGEIGTMDDKAPQKFASIFSRATTDFISKNSQSDPQFDINNLLITLERQDNEEYRRRNQEKEVAGQPLMTSSSFNSTYSKVERFRNAFSQVFDKLKFKGVASGVKATRTIFTKDSGEEIDIEHLSTGEKQIIYRGGTILADENDVQIALIDEPEISMHPRWAQKILDFYMSILHTPNNPQIFFATHSEDVLKRALEMQDVLVVRLSRQGNDVICNKAGARLIPTLTAAELNYIIFGTYSIDYHIQLYGYLQHLTSKDTIKAMDTSIAIQPQYLADASLAKPSSFTKNGHTTTYQTLTTFIRNEIDHPSGAQAYSLEELQRSTEFLRKLVEEAKNGTYTY